MQAKMYKKNKELKSFFRENYFVKLCNQIFVCHLTKHYVRA